MPIYGPELDDPVSIPELLRYGLENKPDEDALISLDTGHTWRELDESSTRLARNYLSLGLEPGDRIASLMPNRTALIVHYIACMKSGLIGVPLNYRYMSPEIDHALEVSGASALIAHAERGRIFQIVKMSASCLWALSVTVLKIVQARALRSSSQTILRELNFLPPTLTRLRLFSLPQAAQGPQKVLRTLMSL